MANKGYYVDHDYSVKPLPEDADEVYVEDELVGYIVDDVSVTVREGHGLYETADEARRASFEMRLKGISPPGGYIVSDRTIDYSNTIRVSVRSSESWGDKTKPF